MNNYDSYTTRNRTHRPPKSKHTQNILPGIIENRTLQPNVIQVDTKDQRIKRLEFTKIQLNTKYKPTQKQTKIGDIPHQNTKNSIRTDIFFPNLETVSIKSAKPKLASRHKEVNTQISINPTQK